MTLTRPAEPGSIRGRWLVFGGLAAAVALVDQITKAFVDPRFELAWTRQPVAGFAAPTPVVGDLVRIAKTYNEGGIFGLFGNGAPLLAIASVVVIGIILFYQARTGSEGPVVLTVALGLLLGGAIGNLVDRLRFGHVIDFVDTGIGDFRWYTFNVADSAISVAVLLLLLVSVLGDRLPWVSRLGRERVEPAAPSVSG